MVEVGALAVSPVSSVAHHAASIVHAFDVPAAVHPVIDRHPVSLDRTHLAILAEGRTAAVLQGNRFAPRRLMVISVGSGISAIACIVTASIGVVHATAIITVIHAATVVGVGAATVVGVGAAAVVGVGATTIVRAGGSARATIVRIGAGPAVICAACHPGMLGTIPAGALRHSGVLCRSGMLRGSGMRRSGGLCRGWCFWRRTVGPGDGGYGEKNQQDRRFRQGVLNSIAQIHSRSCEM